MMKSVLRSKKGLSTAIVTLIVPVVSVLLATVVTFYATNITSTMMQTEEVSISKAHIWANSTDKVAAFVDTNLGGKDIP